MHLIPSQARFVTPCIFERDTNINFELHRLVGLKVSGAANSMMRPYLALKCKFPINFYKRIYNLVVKLWISALHDWTRASLRKLKATHILSSHFHFICNYLNLNAAAGAISKHVWECTRLYKKDSVAYKCSLKSFEVYTAVQKNE